MDSTVVGITNRLIELLYGKDPLTIEREVVLRRLVKQYQQKDIPDAYKGLLHDKHRIILNRVISQSRK